MFPAGLLSQHLKSLYTALICNVNRPLPWNSCISTVGGIFITLCCETGTEVYWSLPHKYEEQIGLICLAIHRMPAACPRDAICTLMMKQGSSAAWGWEGELTQSLMEMITSVVLQSISWFLETAWELCPKGYLPPVPLLPFFSHQNKLCL